MSSVEEIHFVHHCHTDIGYTHDQPTLWDLQRRFIDEAIDLADRDRDIDAPHAFRWTVETTTPLLRWLEDADDDRIDLFLELEAAGRIEVTGMFANLTPLYGPAQIAESLEPVRHLREAYGIEITNAMNCDVNGQNWPLADALLDADIDGFSMAINEHFGGAPLERPLAFRWEAPSGRELLSLNGFHYSTGWALGIGHDAEEFAEKWWPRLDTRLEELGYELPVLHIQSFHPFGDNGSAYPEFSTFIEEWNEREDVCEGDLPRIRMVTPSTYWEVVDEHRESLPTHRGDWTDFWNFGSGSSARETAINRESRRRLNTADVLEAGLTLAGAGPNDRHPAHRSASGSRDAAWWALNFYDEHTWGADVSIREPHSDDTQAQWHHKANYAYEARSHSNRLQRDGLAELARRVLRDGGDGDE
ncbi:hypothetical protein [Halomontanus rarus]|uniref:glycoside hydrolase family 38 N-terminal domain-containing protein n=1 Tax=Halomontanus rarus TaxID=3034020 RepID=UPI0023E8BD7E|nr:hypothetical protein [Halovivax sp. TS33]